VVELFVVFRAQARCRTHESVPQDLSASDFVFPLQQRSRSLTLQHQCASKAAGGMAVLRFGMARQRERRIGENSLMRRGEGHISGSFDCAPVSQLSHNIPAALRSGKLRRWTWLFAMRQHSLSERG
jgi:hypothetical protein